MVESHKNTKNKCRALRFIILEHDKAGFKFFKFNDNMETENKTEPRKDWCLVGWIEQAIPIITNFLHP